MTTGIGEPVAWQFRQRSGVGKGPQSQAPWCDWCGIEREDYERYLRQPNPLIQVRPLYASPQPAQCSAGIGEPAAWTNGHQLSYLKHPDYAEIPMAMWAKPSASADIPLYRHPAQAATDPLKQPQYIIEGIILRRIHEKRIEGYTIEMAKEIADALSMSSTMRRGPCQVCGETADLKCGPSRFGEETWACADCWEPKESESGK